MLNKEWNTALGDIENTALVKILSKHNEQNISNYSVYSPRKHKDLFNAFNKCPWKDLKLVIFGGPLLSPCASTGLCLGLEYGKQGEEIESINADNFEKLLKNIKQNFAFRIKDKTFSSLAEQGILFLPSALTRTSVILRKKLLEKLWFNFNKQVVDTISTKHNNIIFLAIEGETKLFEYINMKTNGKPNGHSMFLLPTSLNKRDYTPEATDIRIFDNILNRIADKNNNFKFKW